MSEFYRASDNSSDEVSQPVAETGPAAQADHQPARDDAARQRQDDAAIEARLDEAGLPTRAESRAAALRPDTDDEDDEDDFSPESDAAIEARLDEAGLPTRAESRAAALRSDADDEDDDYDNYQAAEYNGVLGALTVEGHATGDRDRVAAGDAQQAAGSPDDQLAGSPDSNTEASAEMAERADAEITELFTELEVVLGREGAGQLRTHYERLVRGDQESPDASPAGTADDGTVGPARTTELAAVDTGDRTTEVEARRRTEVAEVEARPDQEIADPRAHMGQAEHVGRAEPQPSGGITGQERGVTQQDAFKAEKPQTRDRRLPTNEALALGAAAVGLVPAISVYVPFAHADVAGVAASVVGVGAATVTWIRARGEERHAHRSED